MDKNVPLFQDVIMRLERFWADQGCLIWQPYNVQVGAGTMNPATFLRVLGPEPWRVAYVEPSVRPADGRYAENPNRWQQYYQYQVILKPDPGDPQELYLRSLEAIGVDLSRHDVRFVEDNWESPALGAWGLGWEVWCDGQEISQYTYMQQAGGFVCDPVSVEITYGLERIMLFLQGARSFLDIAWQEGITYGDLLHRQEVEHCTYNFELADVERLSTLYRTFEAEALAALERKLVMPAYDYVLKCSHTFNVLDARGAVGVTERAGFFGRMRELAHQVAALYLEQRQAADYPLMRRQGWLASPGRCDVPPMPAPEEQVSEFLLEIGTEELPHEDLQAALEQLRQAVPTALAEARLGYLGFEVEGTPRRLAVMVHGLEPWQVEEVRVVKGPPAQVGFGADGKPTKAAEGFALRNGLSVQSLEVAEIDGGRYVVARIRKPGRAAAEALADLLPRLVASLRFTKSMRWNGSGAAFSRPLRWFVSLLGDAVVPFEYAGIVSGRRTRLLRNALNNWADLADASSYGRVLSEAGIVLSVEERRRLIAQGLEQLAASAGGKIMASPGLLEEVADLVEAPRPILGSFAEEYLALPPEVLITVMRKHQRYFAVEKDGRLLPNFIAVRNGGDGSDDLVREGNEAVLRARFADAAYFFKQDLAHSLEDFLPRLATLTFQERLGSMLDKTRRLERLAPIIGSWLGLTPEEEQLVRRAAKLCKADLATQMVVEFTSLQGVMGRIYALRQGEDERVAAAIFEHYLPRNADDSSPTGRIGLALGVADRLDSILGLFAAGLEPSGSADPYALRRSASGLVQNLINWKAHLDLRRALATAVDGMPVQIDEAVRDRALAFIGQRLRVYLMEQGLRYDVCDAALAERMADPYAAWVTASQLQFWVASPGWMDTLNAYARCKRITRDVSEQYQLRPEELGESASRELYQAWWQHGRNISPSSSVDDLVRALQALTPAINRFFDEVLVMADDPALRRNRLALVQAIAKLPSGIADLSRLEGF